MKNRLITAILFLSLLLSMSMVFSACTEYNRNNPDLNNDGIPNNNENNGIIDDDLDMNNNIDNNGNITNKANGTDTNLKNNDTDNMDNNNAYNGSNAASRLAGGINDDENCAARMRNILLNMPQISQINLSVNNDSCNVSYVPNNGYNDSTALRNTIERKIKTMDRSINNVIFNQGTNNNMNTVPDLISPDTGTTKLPRLY